MRHGCGQVEFYDEDEDVSGYEDNQYEFNSFNCVDFKVRSGDEAFRVVLPRLCAESDIEDDLHKPQ